MQSKSPNHALRTTRSQTLEDLMIHTAKRFGSILAMGLLISASACSDSDDDGVRVEGKIDDAESATKVDPAMAQAALNELTASVDVTITDFGAASPAVPPPAPAAGSGAIPPAAPAADGPGVGSAATQGGLTLNCSAGGNANVGGFVSVVPEPVINVDVNAMITYNNCVTLTGTTLDGTIEFSQSVAAGAGPAVQIETTYTGDVTLRGRVNAHCPVDLNVLVDATGRGVSVGGTFCGEDASELNLQIMPRWSAAR